MRLFNREVYEWGIDKFGGLIGFEKKFGDECGDRIVKAQSRKNHLLYLY
jgi:hypothetical protein